MSSKRHPRSMTRWLLIALVIGFGIQIIWVILFWDNDDVWPWHWLAVPISILTYVLGTKPWISIEH